MQLLQGDYTIHRDRYLQNRGKQVLLSEHIPCCHPFVLPICTTIAVSEKNVPSKVDSILLAGPVHCIRLVVDSDS